MCNFITATLPAGADTPAFRAAVDAAGLCFAPLRNRYIQTQLHPTEAYFHATRGHCDCSSGLGRRPDARQVDDQSKKLRARGWSEAKIAAWQRTQGPRPKSREELEQRGDLTLDNWLTFLRIVLPRAGYVGLLQHQYRSSTVDERFEITRERRRVSELEKQVFPWRENVLYEIVAD